MTGNVKQAKDFYAKLLGWTYEDHTMEDGRVYTMICCREKKVGGLLQAPQGKETIPPHWTSYISVDNLDATVEMAQTLGAKITVPAGSAGEDGRFAVLQDPTGAYIALWQCSKPC